MSVLLACTWRPHGELPRLRALYPRLAGLYAGMVVVVPPETEPGSLADLEGMPEIGMQVAPHGTWGRHVAIATLTTSPADYVHYIDLDRLLHWAETRLAELRMIVDGIPSADCLIIGRSPAAVDSHPQTLQATEALVNAVFSYLLGQPVDLCGGSRGFSRAAVTFLLRNSPPGRLLGTDAEWPVLLQRGGFALDYRAVDGLDWETADRYRQTVADSAAQRRLAADIDRDAQRWEQRVRFAQEIVAAGLAAMQQPLAGS